MCSCASLSPVEPRHDAEREPHVPACRSDARQELIHLDVVCEREDELVDDLVVAHRPRDRRDLDVGRPLPDEVLSVEPAHVLEPDSSGHHGHVVDVRVLGHRRHRRVEVQVNELRSDVLVEDRADVGASLPSRCGTYLVSHALDMPGGAGLNPRHAPPRGRLRAAGDRGGGDLAPRGPRRREARSPAGRRS